jgi:3-oxosteroid 1-dehydrogenase
MKSLDPEYDAVRKGGAAFPSFPGAAESAHRVVRSTYSSEIANKNRCQRDDSKPVRESEEVFYTCLWTGMNTGGVKVPWGTPAIELVVDGEAENVELVRSLLHVRQKLSDPKGRV